MPREKSPTTPTIRKRAPRKSTLTQATTSFTQFVGPEQRSALIAEAAFLRAERRGFAPGSEIEDWLAAESEVDANLLHAVESDPRG